MPVLDGGACNREWRSAAKPEIAAKHSEATSRSNVPLCRKVIDKLCMRVGLLFRKRTAIQSDPDAPFRVSESVPYSHEKWEALESIQMKLGDTF
jgi:hypothetical protein